MFANGHQTGPGRRSLYAVHKRLYPPHRSKYDPAKGSHIPGGARRRMGLLLAMAAVKRMAPTDDLLAIPDFMKRA